VGNVIRLEPHAGQLGDHVVFGAHDRVIGFDDLGAPVLDLIVGNGQGVARVKQHIALGMHDQKERDRDVKRLPKTSSHGNEMLLRFQDPALEQEKFHRMMPPRGFRFGSAGISLTGSRRRDKPCDESVRVSAAAEALAVASV